MQATQMQIYAEVIGYGFIKKLSVLLTRFYIKISHRSDPKKGCQPCFDSASNMSVSL